jgi:oligopeptide transport system ATP-binding protein
VAERALRSRAATPAPPTEGPLLEARGLEVRFDLERTALARVRRERASRVHAVDGVDLAVWPGEALGLVGESGSGKTTVARALLGLIQPSAGEIAFQGRVLPPRRERAERRRVQMVFQDPYSSLNPRMTVGDTLRELLRTHRLVPRSQVDARCLELLELVGLGRDALGAYPRQFSGGQRQRVAIARAIALEPDVLVADEPVSALDVSVQATILNLLKDLQRELGLSLLLIAHNLAVVRHLCDRVAVMYLGRIVETAPAETLFADPRHPYTQGLLRAIPRLRSAGGAETVAVRGDPPSPLRLPEGCRFHPRCPVAQDRCRVEDPALTSGPSADPPGEGDLAAHGEGDLAAHSAACHFAWASPTISTTAARGEADQGRAT